MSFYVSQRIPVCLSPRAPREAWGFLETLLASPTFDLLMATERHAAVLAQTLAEMPDMRGNLFHDLHIAVLKQTRSCSGGQTGSDFPIPYDSDSQPQYTRCLY